MTAPNLGLALTHVLRNAVEHNDADRPRVWLSVDGLADRQGDWVTVRVADDGPGIPEEERTAATDPTEQTDLAHSTGLGLWEVGQVTDTLGGDVRFETREGGGNVVSLHLRGRVGNEQRTEV